MNTWIQYGRGKVIKLYVRDRVIIKIIFALTGWYSNVLLDVVGGIATPAMERYTLGSLSIIMMFFIVWPDTWLSCYVTGTSIIWMSKRVHAG